LLSVVETYLDEHFSKDHFNTFSKDFLRKLKEERDDNIDIRHVINPPYVISFYEAIKEDVGDLDEFEKHFMNIDRDSIENIIKMQQSLMRSSENKWAIYIEGTKEGNASLYDNDLFNLEVLEDNEKNYKLVLRKCYYYEILKKRGYEHLGPVLCNYEHILIDGVDEWITFTREETIANGAEKCDFFFSPKPSAFEKAEIVEIRKKEVSRLFFKCAICGHEEEAPWEFTNKQSSRVDEIRDIPMHCNEQMRMTTKPVE
jgi:hypothetical protein